MTDTHPPGRVPERTLAEIEACEEDIERVIVRATKHGVTSAELAVILRDHAAELDGLAEVCA